MFLSCAWLLGILLGSTFSPALASLFIGLAPLPLLFFLPGRRKAIILSTLSLLVFFGAASYSASSRSQAGEHYLRFYNDRGVLEVKGTVSRDPEVGSEATRLHLSGSEISIAGKWCEVSGTALTYVPRYPEYQYGDVLIVKGRLAGKPPGSADWSDLSDTSDRSDYWDYLANQGVYSIMSYPSVEVLERGTGSPFLGWVYSLRNRMSDTLARLLPEPHASLAQGITLGLRTNMPQDLKDDFSRTGTTHVLAISGVNLTIVAGILVTVTVWLLGRRHHVHIWVTLAVIWLYSVLTGLQPPVLRAAVMLSFFLAADLFGRQRSGVIALLLAAAMIVGFSPTAIRDPSFQLSIMAMAGLIFICPPLQSMGRIAVERVTGEGRPRAVATMVADGLVVSLGAMVATWPLIAYYFGIVSWVGIPATFVTLPVMPAIIVTGIVSGGLGLAFLPLGQALGWLAWLPLSYLLLVITGFAGIPGASLETGTVGPGLVVTYYAALALVLVSLSQRTKLSRLLLKTANLLSGLPWKWVITPLATLATLVWLTASTIPDNDLHVSFLDVGQGDAILIERGHLQILVDGGPDPQATLLELSEKMPFWDRTIEMVVLTHPHADHLTGLVEVLRRYRVKHVLSPDLADDSPLFAEWKRLIDERGIRHETATSGQVISFGDHMAVSVLNPRAPVLAGTGSDVDNNGVVLRVNAGRVSFLLTADIMQAAEMELITRRAGLDSTVLKVAHHGSASSTSEEFLAVVSPQIAVISVGAENGYGHPNEAVVSLLAEHLGSQNIYRTDENGAIEFITNGERLWVRTERQ
ncbi:MAG: DNA internalization-related competence protein ComEC/Rec2 [Chloroflexi bacterium RBG_16_57_8]|nr:MAG: DNA internalization-related competence protein ComEC/Rec2 [Chloroflexi bacterium RBG_16_57_8]